ncbi:hypothetical protein PN290_01295 [Romboutsia sp. 1001216sp1]|uniref:hypothetical protein n=1 Tax=Romboutsia TaxID=1501226 RepID=UPI00159EE0CF|nr:MULTISPECIES: hypothetical protein [Romboutsia]MDB8791698.1 hypothetical protein [Romboutsia sp. 1001216sp1]MDB8794642.1 hypothetical protein [Romboutsia sp. 1001216sp1]MDB8796523.1 hypothetical protein [Romboutsia sp. 1001216sp1]MDB8798001.1 hypothetical protein [Romboutsia sp. 1001216sp1]MDB8801268.1 hypothetical protein [Romboutsia sp. 1001216sp1]
MFEIVNYKHLNKRPIIIGRELGFKRLIELDEAVVGRTIKMCSNYLVGLNYFI